MNIGGLEIQDDFSVSQYVIAKCKCGGIVYSCAVMRGRMNELRREIPKMKRDGYEVSLSTPSEIRHTWWCIESQKHMRENQMTLEV